MLAGLASPSHLIILLALVLLLFGAKRIPELAKGVGTGIKELHEGISTGQGAGAEAEALESEEAGSGAGSATRIGSMGEPVAARADRGGL
ncbi:MAG TPA: twin-arginine translocase TatA/TatE family subunit [Rubrobacter sp.]|nr:twin-arginine translocase TatA/TatE family subunit [Rubrobacter sp.]